MSWFSLAALVLVSLGAPDSADRNAELVAGARVLAGARTEYEASYRALSYPGGDPPAAVGVCTDLVVRAYRAVGVDFQRLVHEDMKRHFDAYPSRRHYGLKKPDPNIDHRRVTILTAFLKRKGRALGKELTSDWQPGDIVIFDLYDNGGTSHIGIISDRRAASGRPLVFHHYPPFPAEDDCLADWTIAGHYRFLPRPR